MNQQKPIPIYILSGFLGSGKTTLLTKAIGLMTEAGRKPAVVMNEIGEVNLDGQLIQSVVPMAEMLSGCICCSIREDLGTTIHELLTEHEPDVIFIEATGVANPLEIVDEVTDASFMLSVELSSVITVVDAPQLLQLSRTSTGQTYQLMKDQVICASILAINKTDLLPASELAEVVQLVRGWNPHAAVELTVYSQIDASLWEKALEYRSGGLSAPSCGCGHCDNDHNQYKHHDHHDHHEHADQLDRHRDSEHHDLHAHHRHHHDHVIAYTHYFQRAIDSNEFERFLTELPPEIYRAKGILTFSDTESRFMFQYAYGQVDFVKISPQGEVNNVAVFIGEHFPKDKIRVSLEELEKRQQAESSKE